VKEIYIAEWGEPNGAATVLGAFSTLKKAEACLFGHYDLTDDDHEGSEDLDENWVFYFEEHYEYFAIIRYRLDEEL